LFASIGFKIINMGISRIKLGIIGAGRMGITHFSIINTHPQVSIVSVVDSSGLVLSLI